jgi:hypothetical protein
MPSRKPLEPRGGVPVSLNREMVIAAAMMTSVLDQHLTTMAANQHDIVFADTLLQG